MPQKRNPYALVVIRGAAGTLLGRATGVLATQRTPSGRTDNLLYAYGEVAGAIDLATRVARPRRRHRREPAASTAQPARAPSAEASRWPPTWPRPCAYEHGLDYRSAYRVVGRAVRDNDLTADGLHSAARDLLDRDLDIAPERLAETLGPAQAIATRTVTGGAAPEPMDAMLDAAQAATDAARTRLDPAPRRASRTRSRH